MITKKLLTAGWISILSFWAFGVFPASVLAPAQGACNASARADGLVTTPSDISGTKFGTTAGACVFNTNQAALAPLQLQSYDTLKSIYYDQAKVVAPVVKQAGGPGSDPTFSGNNLWHMPTGYDPGTINPNGSGTQVIFIDSNLIINHDIIFHGGDQHGATAGGFTADSNGALVFVVNGSININPSVHHIDAYLISGGVICTSYPGSGLCPAGFDDANKQSDLTQPSLVINGGLIALNASAPISFRREMLLNTIEAERVNYQPKYLELLKNMFSETLNITTQNTNYGH